MQFKTTDNGNGLVSVLAQMEVAFAALIDKEKRGGATRMGSPAKSRFRLLLRP